MAQRFREIPTEYTVPPPGSYAPGDAIGDGPNFKILWENVRLWIASTASIATARIAGLDATLLSLQNQIDALDGDSFQRDDTLINASGNTLISPAAGKTYFKGLLTVSGAAGERNVALQHVNRNAGDRLRLVVLLPASEGVVLYVRDGTVSGTILATFFTVSDQAQEGILDVEYDGSSWRREFTAQNTLPQP